MQTHRPGIWSLVAVPAVLTLLVTLLRLVGELRGWSPELFGTAAGGAGTFVGISWLVPVFGWWFGWRLQRAGAGVRWGWAALLYLAGIGVFAGGLFAANRLGLLVFPSEEHSGEVQGLAWFLGVMALAAVVGFVAWPRLSLTLLVYGLLARLPVVVVTWFAVHRQWDTHYSKLGPGLTASSPDDAFIKLSQAQVTFWIFTFTLLVGGVFGSLGAAMAGKRTATR
jgi:hypothetical protein